MENNFQPLTDEEQKVRLYNAVNFMTQAANEIQPMNGMLSLSLLAQADVLLAHLKYIETGVFQYTSGFTNQNQCDQCGTSNLKIDDSVREEIDALAEELKAAL